MKMKKISILLILWWGIISCFAQIPPRPNPPRLVNDFAKIMTREQVNQLEDRLVAFNDTTSNMICVVTVSSLNGMEASEFAYEIGDQWGVRSKEAGKNNGVVILIKPKKGNERGQANISPGYGMEEYVTDATAKVIIEKEMIPAFRDDDYYTGIDDAVNVIIDLCSGKFTQDEYTDGSSPIPFWFILLVIIALFLIFRSNNGNQNYSGGGQRTIWIPMGGGFGGGGFGGGSFGGGSGGFGGFGGGGFGGGGASGSW